MDRVGISDPEEVRRLVAEHGRWWHEIELGHGIVTPGDDSNRSKLPILDQLGLPRDLSGLRVLDIGCSDGYFTFEAERRGATVVAIDFVPEHYTGFATAKKILGSRAEYRMDNVYNLSPREYGTFDIVLFLGVLYHLRNPLGAVDAIRSVMHDGAQLFVGTMMIDEYVLMPDRSVTTLAALNPALESVPLWQFYPGDTLNGDFTNCFAPNRRALEALLFEAQFDVQEIRVVSMGGYANAVAITDARREKYRKLDSRLKEMPFDPSVPYFLDEEGSIHDVTPRKHSQPEAATSAAKPWWKKWR